jgi:hypothetical protein
MASCEIKLLVSAFRWAIGVREQGAEKDIWSWERRGYRGDYIMRSFIISILQYILSE